MLAGHNERMAKLGEPLRELVDLRIEVEPWEPADTKEFLHERLVPSLLELDLRSVVKEIFGIPVFVFMFVTSRAQGLHDLLAGARVIIRDPLIAAEVDHFKPAQGPTGRPASRVRRIVVTLIYNVLLLVFLGARHSCGLRVYQPRRLPASEAWPFRFLAAVGSSWEDSPSFLGGQGGCLESVREIGIDQAKVLKNLKSRKTQASRRPLLDLAR